jgi:aromatic ring-cleaving dioxygenase
MTDLEISGFHLHVYYDLDDLPTGIEVHRDLLKGLTCIDGCGPVKRVPVGPHPKPSFEVWFQNSHLGEVVLWVLQNRRGLSALIHPLTKNEIRDHSEHAVWIGSPLTLDFTFLK